MLHMVLDHRDAKENKSEKSSDVTKTEEIENREQINKIISENECFKRYKTG